MLFLGGLNDKSPHLLRESMDKELKDLLTKLTEQFEKLIEQNDEIIEKLDNLSKDNGDGYGFD